MSKITLDRETFKALASDTRLDILRALDGRNLSLKDICKTTNLNKATLHEHLAKLHDAGLVKRKERDGHKWVYYKLTWKGESLLHPENTKIVVMFTTTFIILWAGIIQLYWYVKGTLVNIGYDVYRVGEDVVLTKSNGFLEQSVNEPGSNHTLSLPGILPKFFPNESYFSNSNVSSIPINGNLSYFDSSGGSEIATGEGSRLVVDESHDVLNAFYQNPTFLYIAIACFIIFTVILCFSLWRLWENKTPKL